MSEKKWTKEQEMAIKLNGTNMLVSAAAGSGKTSVLVARIINKIINEGVDIDKILVVTFTNAAASEMRQRLMDEIYKKIDENPNSQNLQRQLLLINKANISTIHSFCLNVIRNNFFEIGMSANFRVADETEIEIMKQEIIEDIFEDLYESQNEDFLRLLDIYTTYKDDTNLKELILKIYDFIQSNPFPEKWLTDAVEDYNIAEADFGNTKWGKMILEEAREVINNNINNLKIAINNVSVYSNLSEFTVMLNKDLTEIENIDLSSWDLAYKGINAKKWDSWKKKTKVTEEEKEAKEIAKAIRDFEKSEFGDIQGVIRYSSKEAIEDIKEMYIILKSIQNIVFIFSNEFNNRKREKNIVDFNDIEHLALKILVDENGKPTETAKKYEFNEIEIDEYQDSNSVQEYILTSVSNGNNIFMVGDVKQSIYKFRQANPKLFMKKYNEYKLPEENKKEDTKILLYKNFRSRNNILDITNMVFKNIMSEKLGEIEYTDEEALNLGGDFENPKIDCQTELNIIETDKSENEDTQEIIENAALEARLVAKKIIELHNKDIPYKDMTILLRSPKQVANIYEKELADAGIPVFSDITTEYLNTIEIDTIMSILKIIDNPLQDIPLVTIMRSVIGGFSDNELIEIRLVDKSASFYRAVEKARNNEEISEKLKIKLEKFIELLEKLKETEKELPLNEFIWYIYTETGYYHYAGLMPDGRLRQANLKKLFEKAKEYEKISFKGIFNFIIFMEKVGTNNKDLEAARIIGENDDVVRIMSIHKSKGLEFPIVFLCGANKRFNLRDMTEKIILDSQVGIGSNYNLNGIEFQLLTKEAIKFKMKKESISEEMRVFYVALTRAKDKLIITGTSDNVEKRLQNKQNELSRYYKFNRPQKINPRLVAKCKTYLEWLELVYKYNEDSKIRLNIVPREELLENNKESENKEIISKKEDIIKLMEGHEIDKEQYEEIEKLLNFKYKYERDIELPTKTSVTALKQEKIINKKIPFFEENKKITGAKRGTLIHLVLSKITTERNVEDVKKLISSLKEKKVITLDEEMAIDMKTIANYIDSELYKEILEAKEVKREIPFYLNMDSNEIYEGTDEKILVQGVIDLYYISKNDELVLIDYKTDYVENDEQELVEKYKRQLELYKLALEKSLNKKVDNTYIYSTYLNKNIEIY